MKVKHFEVVFDEPLIYINIHVIFLFKQNFY